MNVVEVYGKSHPNKVADQIADAIIGNRKDLSNYIEVMINPTEVYVCGTLDSFDKLVKKEIEKTVDKVLKNNKYKSHKVLINICQSPNTVLNPPISSELATYYGYATNETDNFMPLAYNMATELEKCIANTDSISTTSNGKCQIVLNNKNKISRIVLSHFSKNPFDFEKVVDNILNNNIVNFGKDNTLFKSHMEKDCKVFVNPIKNINYQFGKSGSALASDTYGGLYHSPTEQMSGMSHENINYAGVKYAHELAKQVVEKGLATECEVKFSVVPGSPELANVECIYCDTGSYDEINKFLDGLDLSIPTLLEKFKNNS